MIRVPAGKEKKYLDMERREFSYVSDKQQIVGLKTERTQSRAHGKILTFGHITVTMLKNKVQKKSTKAARV